MTTAFSEFSDTYREFQERFPDHPLAEEIRSTIARGRFPKEKWLQWATGRMRELLDPIWLEAG